jgi:excisionase family DNA binding protein
VSQPFIDTGGNRTMPHVTLGEASRQTGRSKSQVSRAIRDGKLSAERSVETGSFRIEQSELQRWQDATTVVRATASISTGEDSATTLQQSLEAQIAGLKELAALLREQRDDALSQRDKWEVAYQAQRLLIPPPPQPATPEASPPETKVPKKKASRLCRLVRWLNG